MHDFIYKLRFLQMNSYDGDERKNPEIYTETKEKSPVWLPSHPPVYNDQLFPPSELSSENMFRLDESIFGVW